jgi:hypothetical protein
MGRFELDTAENFNRALPRLSHAVSAAVQPSLDAELPSTT